MTATPTQIPRLEKQSLSSVEQVQIELGSKNLTSSRKATPQISKTDLKSRKNLQVSKAVGSQYMTASLISKDLGLSNSEQIDGQYWGTNDGVYIGFEKGTGSTIPAYYNLGEAIRVYNGNTINLISENSNIYITDIEFTFYQDNKWTTVPEISSGTYSLNTQSWSGRTQQLTITSSQKVFIQQVTFTYVIEENDPTPDSTPTDELTLFVFNASEWTYIGEGEFKDAWFNNFWNGGEALPYEVPIYQSNNNQNVYLIANPYGPSTPYADINVYSESIPGYLLVNLSNPDIVIVRPLVYAATFNSTEGYVPIYLTNLEGSAFYQGLSYSEISERLQENGMRPSTYDASTGRIDIRNAVYSISKENPFDLYSTTEIPQEGYIILPGFNGGNSSDVNTITIAYHVNNQDNDTFETQELKLGSDDVFDVTLNNIDRFWFISSSSLALGVNLYESTLGLDLPVVYTLATFKPYVYTPWAGNYRIRLTKNLSYATITTTTPKPNELDICLPGDYNDWKFDSSNRFQKVSAGEYTYTVPADITGSWKIASPNWQYDYSYAGAVNPVDTYEFAYNTTENTTLPLYKGDVVKISFNADIYSLNATVNIIREKSNTDEPPVSGDSKTVDINGVVYTLYPSEGYFMATDGSKAKGEVSLITSTEDLTLRGIASGAFTGNKYISSVIIPEGAVNIGDEAFRECDNLQTIILPSTITSIGKYAFLDCSYLTYVSLPASVKNIGIGAFQNCTDMEVFKFNEAAISEIPDALFEGCTRLSEVMIPTTVEKIGANAFLGSGVVKIGDTSNVISIGARAFEDSKIAQFAFNNTESIGAGAFAGTYLKVADLPSSITSINEQAFLNCTYLAKVTLPSKIKEISKSTFEGCESLTTVEIPESVTAIWDKAFYNSGLVTVNIGNNVTELGAEAFVTNSLTAVTLGSGIKTLENEPLYTEGMLRLNSSTPPTLGSNRLGCTPTVVIVPKGSGSNYRSNNRWKQYNIIEEGDEIVIYLSAPGALTADLRMKQVLAAQVTSLIIKTDPSKGTLNDTDWKSIKSNMKSLIKLDISDADIKQI